MKKRILALLTIIALVLCLMPPAVAEASTVTASGYCGGEGDGKNLTWKLTSDDVLTISGEGAMEDWENSTSVPWYGNRQAIQSVIIGDSVTTIGNSAFSLCTSLETVTIPDSVTTIGNSAFEYCSALTTVTIPDSVTTIGDYAFCYCTSLEAVTIPASVTTIGNSAFYWCENLATVTIGDSVTTIGDAAFSYCTRLTEIRFEGDAPTFGDGVFYGVTATAYYPAGNPTWKDDILQNHGGDIIWVPVGGDPTEIIASGSASPYPYIENTPNGYGMADLAKGDDGQYLTPNGERVYIAIDFPLSFWLGGNSLADYVNVYGEAYFDMTNWDTLIGMMDKAGVIPCTDENLALFTPVIAGNPAWGEDASYAPYYFLYYNDYACLTWEMTAGGTLTISGTGAMSNDIPWSRYRSFIKAVVIGDEVTSIGDYAFNNYKKLTEIYFEGDAPTFGESVFSGVTATAYYPAGNDTWTDEVKQPYGGTITWEAYQAGPTEKTPIDPAELVGTWNLYAWDQIGGGQYTEVPNDLFIFTEDALLYLRDYEIKALHNYTWVDEDTISLDGNMNWDIGYNDENVLVITDGEYLFVEYFCTKADSEPIIPAAGFCGGEGDGKNVNWVLNSAGKLFISGEGEMRHYTDEERAPWNGYCEDINSIVVSEGVTGIGDYAFDGCENLVSVDLPDTLESIGFRSFYGCSSLETIEIPQAVFFLSAGAFGHCNNLTGITVHSDNTVYKSIDGIVWSADGTTLHTVPASFTGMFTIPEGTKTIAGYTFWGCSGLTGVTIPNSVVSIGPVSFSHCSALTEVTIPASVTTIGKGTFNNCVALTKIRFGGDAPAFGENVFLNVTATAYYPAGNETWTEEVMGDYGGDIAWESYTEKYKINSITIRDNNGEELSEIPTGSFLVTVSITNVASKGESLVLLASYTSAGQYQGMMWVSVEDVPIGATIKITLPVDNSDGKIANLQAFMVASFSNLTPLGEAVSFLP